MWLLEDWEMLQSLNWLHYKECKLLQFSIFFTLKFMRDDVICTVEITFLYQVVGEKIKQKKFLISVILLSYKLKLFAFDCKLMNMNTREESCVNFCLELRVCMWQTQSMCRIVQNASFSYTFSSISSEKKVISNTLD